MSLPRFDPMPLAFLPAPFDDPDWLFEVKYDGFRALAYIDCGEVRLVSRRRNVYKSFNGLCSSMASCLAVQNAILDGEIVHLDSDGKPQFYDLLRRRSPHHFVVFDVLWLNGSDLTKTRLIERKAILRSIIPVRSVSVLYADHTDGHGRGLFQEVCESDMEGIVAKRKDGLYLPDQTTWVKVKNRNYSQNDGRWELFEKRRPAVA